MVVWLVVALVTVRRLEPLEAMAAMGRRVVFYDQLGNGNSARPSDPSLWTVALDQYYRYTADAGFVRKMIPAMRRSLDWLAQRVTAVAMAVYTLLLLAMLLWFGGISIGVGGNLIHLLLFVVLVLVVVRLVQSRNP